MIQSDSKDKGLNMEINTRLFKEHFFFFFFFAGNLKIQVKHHLDFESTCMRISLTHL